MVQITDRPPEKSSRRQEENARSNAVGIMFIAGILIIAFLVTVSPKKNDHQNTVNSDNREGVPIAIPSDPSAQYYIIEKGGQGVERTLTIKRVGSSGTSYSRRIFNCQDRTVKYLGTGDSLAAAASSNPDANMSPITDGSIPDYEIDEACR